MNILWITGRRLNKDLASQTELKIANSLSDMGVNITMVSPGDIPIQNNNKIDFLTLNESKIIGLKTISAGLSIKKTLSRMQIKFNHALVDWRMVQFCSSYLEMEGISWSLIDRGPPTFDGLLARIQKYQWRNSWKIANKKTEMAYVVSEAHSIYVENRTLYKKKKFILPAGVDKDWIIRRGKKITTEVNICYCGSLDKNRGLSEILELSKNLKSLPIKSKIFIIGNGNYVKNIKDFSSQNSNLEYLGKITDRRKLELILESCHVGIMPMPDKEIWNISSSIKLPEYLSKGMLIIGVEHPGNIDGFGPFYQLSSSNWPQDSIEKLSKIIENRKWEEYSLKSLEKVHSMTWNKTAKVILDSINR